MNLKELTFPFSLDDIEWRIQSSGKGNNGIWARVIAYISSRAVQDRLDEVCGPENWQNKIRVDEIGSRPTILSGISIRINKEWVTKWDGAEPTAVEPVKGGLSASMKRAAVLWGIGRYLYRLEENWAVIDQNGSQWGKTKDGDQFRWNPPMLPQWALPENMAADNMPNMDGYDKWKRLLEMIIKENEQRFLIDGQSYNDGILLSLITEMRPHIRAIMEVYKIPDNDISRFNAFNNPDFFKDAERSVHALVGNKKRDSQESKPPL